MPPSTSLSVGTATVGAKTLQERLHNLLTKLSKTIDVIKDWPASDGHDASIHHKTTTKLISSIMDVIHSLESVEDVVKADTALRKSLQDCAVPINLLDLLDHGNGLNPDCFSRGLLSDALEQLAGLKRRKLALEMLGSAVQKGLNERLAKDKKNATKEQQAAVSTSKKRRRDDNNGNNNNTENDGKDGEPDSKKIRSDG